MCAVLAIGIKYPLLHGIALDCTIGYLQNCLSAINSSSAITHESGGFVGDVGLDEILETANISLSLLGFLEAASTYAHFYSVSERLDVVSLLRLVLSEDFMVSVEGVFSSIRTSDPSTNEITIWKSYTKRYAALGRPLGAMLLQRGFMKLLVSCSSLQIATPRQLQQADIFDILMLKNESIHEEDRDASVALIELLSDIAIEEMSLLEDGADYLQLGSAWQQRLAFAVKAHTLNTFLNCMVADEDLADADTLMAWLEDAMADPVQMADSALACAVLKSVTVISRFSTSVASALSRSLPRLIVQGGIQGETINIAARSLAYILQLLSQDAVLTGLYSLGNVLSVGSRGDKRQETALSIAQNVGRYSQHSTGSAISLDLSGDEETTVVYGNVVRAIVNIACTCRDEKITALALSMLLQKLGRVSLAVDLHIIVESAALSTTGGPLELKTLLKLYSRISHDAVIQENNSLLAAVSLSQSHWNWILTKYMQVAKARAYLSKTLKTNCPLFEIYLVHLLESIVSKGDVHESDNTHLADVELAAQEICQLLQPLTDLVSTQNDPRELVDNENIRRLYREAWFNIVVHGISPNSKIGQPFTRELQTLAMQSKPLIAEDRVDQFESEIELNTVLRRGMNAPHIAEQKKQLISLLPRCEHDIRALSYPKVLFLGAAYLIEMLRADTGICNHILTYFLDPSLNGSAMENCMVAIADEVLGIYLKKMLSGQPRDISAPLVAKELSLILAGCCHRIPRVQQIATTCANKIISFMPSSLCQKSSLFALLELLTIMWTSCLEAEIDEYEWTSHFSSVRGGVQVELSDDYELRRSTLNNFHKRARTWLVKVINIAPLDVKGLLQVRPLIGLSSIRLFTVE